jgi:hypothetical protein
MVSVAVRIGCGTSHALITLFEAFFDENRFLALITPS